MNQGFWMAKEARCLTDGEMGYDNSSRIEPKRSHQWFMDGTEAVLFPNKKQAVEVPNNNLFSGMLNSNISPWANASSFHSVSGHFTERLFDSETTRTVNFDGRNVQSVSTGKLNVERKVNEDLFGNDSPFGLSMSHTLEDPRSGLNYGGIRKVKVSQVKDTENVISASMGNAYNSGDNNTISMAHAYNRTDDSSISMGFTYNKGDDNIVTMGDIYGREENNFISMGPSCNKGDDNASMGQIFKENDNTMSMGHTFSKGDANVISISQSYNKADDNTISMGLMYNKEDDSTISMGHTYKKGDNSNLSMGHSYSKGESTIISFGGYDDDDRNPSGRHISNYDLLMGQPSVEKVLVKSNTDALGNTAEIAASVSDSVLKKKDEQKMSKKIPSNNFPSNVRSLLSTGMLDGVPVKYVAWSREKELCGVIKGSGYLCGCQSCNFSKIINAYEFERHAGSKTKHPNNHIYFENGKTIYGIVQELRSTPQNMLFDVIQTITGSPINQKSFRLWKESFLAATRELQRIYGKDEEKQFS